MQTSWFAPITVELGSRYIANIAPPWLATIPIRRRPCSRAQGRGPVPIPVTGRRKIVRQTQFSSVTPPRRQAAKTSSGSQDGEQRVWGMMIS